MRMIKFALLPFLFGASLALVFPPQVAARDSGCKVTATFEQVCHLACDRGIGCECSTGSNSLCECCAATTGQCVQISTDKNICSPPPTT